MSSPPPAVPRTRTSAGTRRRDQILEGALRCFDRLGVTATTVDDIRAESGASVGSIYHHLGSKGDILATLYSEAVSAYRSGLLDALRSEPDVRRALRGAVRFHVGWMEGHQHLARLMLRWDESELTHSGRVRLRKEAGRFNQELGAWLDEAAGRGVIRRLAPELYAALLVGPLLEYGRRQVYSMTTLPAEEIVPELAEAIWTSLAAEAHPHRRSVR
ncbi:MAG: TetR/AcrR family transcriptional regulator [Acidimicrobiales bacterium]